jgi:hypothetical protein
MSLDLLPPTSQTAILQRAIEPDKPTLPPEAARALLRLDFRPEDRERMNELAVRARQGTLATEEDQELDSYIQVGHLLALLHSKARRSLQLAGSSSHRASTPVHDSRGGLVPGTQA